MTDEIHIPDGMPEQFHGESNGAIIDALWSSHQELSAPPTVDGLPDHLTGKPVSEMLSGLVTENAGFREQQANLPTVPTDVSGYAFEPVEAVAPYFPKPEDGSVDPRITFASEAALAAGISSEQFNTFVNGVYSSMAEAGALPEPGHEVLVVPPVDQAAEYATFGKAAKIDGDAELSARVDELTVFGSNYVKAHNLGDAGEDEIAVLAGTATGLSILNALQNDFKERGIEIGGDAVAGVAIDDKEFEQLGASEKVNPQSSEYDAVASQRYEAEIVRRAAVKARGK